MRQFITIGHKPNGEVEVIHGPEKAYAEHRDEFRNLDAGKKKTKATHGFSRIEVVDLSRGVVKARSYGKVKMKGVDDTGKRTRPAVVKDGKRVSFDKEAAEEEQKSAASKRKGYRFGQRRSINDIMPSAAAAPATLEEMTIAQLKAAAAGEEISLTGANTKAEIIDAIEYGRLVNESKDDPSKLEILNKAQLEDLAASEELDVSGARTKAELIDRISAERLGKTNPPKTDEGVFPAT